jgi:type IV secretory pathway protease TraF
MWPSIWPLLHPSVRAFVTASRSRRIWNASASVPVGLYVVERPIGLRVADLIVVRPPEPLAEFLADRAYLPSGVPLLKHVSALAAQSVCRNSLAVTIDGAAIGDARERDSRGRPLPSWQGCRVVSADEVFLMNPRSADSSTDAISALCQRLRSSAALSQSGRSRKNDDVACL